jgi:hypothetical protein
VSAVCGVLLLRALTVDVDVALFHELAELRQPLGCVYFRHVDGAEGGRGVKGSGGSGEGQCVCNSYMWAPQQARDHVESRWQASGAISITLPSTLLGGLSAVTS